MDLFVDELNHMYMSGAWMWDAHLKETFLFKAKLYATVCDWPGSQNAQRSTSPHNTGLCSLHGFMHHGSVRACFRCEMRGRYERGLHRMVQPITVSNY